MTYVGNTIMALEKEGLYEDLYFKERFSSKGYSAHLGIECRAFPEVEMDMEKVAEVISRVRRCEVRVDEKTGEKFVWVNRYTPEKEAQMIAHHSGKCDRTCAGLLHDATWEMRSGVR